MARTMLTRREFFSLAGLAGLGTLAGCSAPESSRAPEPEERATVYDAAAPDELTVLMVGDVLVHAGFAIEVVDEQFAQETLDLIRQFPELAADEAPAA